MLGSARPERMLLATGLAVVLALLYNLWLQVSTVPSCMRYIPPESSAWIVTSPLQDLWTAARPHLAGYFKGPAADEETPMRSIALGLKEDLAEKRIVLERPEDLPALGIDMRANAAAAEVKFGGEHHALLVLPVIDRARFLKTIERYFQKPPVALGSGDRGLYRIEETFLAFGDDGAALLSDSPELLRSVLARQQRYLDHYRGNDRERRLLADGLPAGQERPPVWLRGGVRPDSRVLPLATDLQFELLSQARALAVRVRMALPGGRAEVISRLLARAPAGKAGDVAPLARGEVAATFTDPAAPDLVRLLSLDAVASRLSNFEASFPGLLEELRHTRTLSRISLAAIDTHQSMPGALVGLAMSELDAQALVFGMQRALRLKRDREILREARKRFAQLQPAAAPPTAQALAAAGLLTGERHALWPHYRLTTAEPTAEPPLQAADFDHPAYRRPQAEAGTLRYLMPPFTDDDLRYRFAAEADRAEIEPKLADLKADRYRLCSVYLGDTLWIGNDAQALERWIERLRRGPASPDYADAAAVTPGADAAKLRLILQPRLLLAAGELHPDPEVSKMRRELLADLEQYRAVLLVATTDAVEQEIHVHGSFLRH